MAKTLFKELIIILLLCLAIILILGVLLYGYIPTNKIIPEKVSYIVPENIKKELEETLSSEDLDVILTYEVDSTDLNNYEKINKLNTGKPNPFSSYKKEEIETDKDGEKGNTTSNNNSSSSSSSSNNNKQNSNTNNSNTNNSNGYIKDTGTK